MARGSWLENTILLSVLVVSTLLFTACLLMILLVPPAQ